MRLLFIVFIGLNLLIGQSLLAQQLPIYSLQSQNSFVLNPAFAGLEDYIDMKVSGRRQWIGLDGAPETYYLSVTAPFMRDDLITLSSHGVGGYIWFDRAGPTVQFEGNLSYAFHKKIELHGVLSFGVSLAINAFYLSKSALIGNSYDPDPLLDSIGQRSMVPEVSLGAAYYSENYFLSVALKQLFSGNYYPSTSGEGIASEDVYKSNSHRVMHSSLAGGFIYDLDIFRAAPLISLTYVPTQPLIVDYSLKLYFENDFWVGGSFRSDNTIVAMTGIALKSFLTASYAYDLNLFNFGKGFGAGAHEFVVGFKIPYQDEVQCPKFVW